MERFRPDGPKFGTSDLCLSPTHIQRDIPQYVHRSGRTARAGKSATTITLSQPYAVPHLETIEAATGVGSSGSAFRGCHNSPAPS